MNPYETTLSPTTTFTGLVATAHATDGLIYAQPLYIKSLDGSNHHVGICPSPANIVFVATENNSVYDVRYHASIRCQPMLAEKSESDRRDRHPLHVAAGRQWHAVAPVAADGFMSVSFARAITFKSPAIYPFSIAAGDLNHDGFPDLGVMGDNPQNILHALGKGDGHVGHWSHDGLGRLPGNVLFADVDLDGNLDAVTTDGGAAEIAVALATGAATSKAVCCCPQAWGSRPSKQ